MPFVMARLDQIIQDKPIRLFITFLIAGLVIYMHRGNIVRIMNKTENKFHFKKTVKKQEEGELAEEGASTDEENELTEEDIKRKEENRRKSAKKKK